MFPLLAIVASFIGGAQLEQAEDAIPYVIVYNVQDLELVVPNYNNTPEMDLNSVLNNRSGSIFRNTSNQNSHFQENPQVLMNLVQSIVEPEAWGNTATMTYWNGNIIVNAPKRIHDQIK